MSSQRLAQCQIVFTAATIVELMMILRFPVGIQITATRIDNRLVFVLDDMVQNRIGSVALCQLAFRII